MSDSSKLNVVNLVTPVKPDGGIILTTIGFNFFKYILNTLS